MTAPGSFELPRVVALTRPRSTRSSTKPNSRGQAIRATCILALGSWRVLAAAEQSLASGSLVEVAPG